MRTFTPKKLFGFAFVIIIMANIVVLLGVYQNRKSKPTSLITLTQREMPMRDHHRYDKDIRHRYLALRWNVYDSVDRRSYYSQYKWLDEAKLQELGFDVAKAKVKKLKKYGKIKEFYIAMEMDGKAYQDYLIQREKTYEEKRAKYTTSARDDRLNEWLKYEKGALKRAKIEDSRLFIIDAAKDFDTLRNKYPKAIITKAQIEMRRDYYLKKYHVEGLISKVMIPKVHLSKKDVRELQNILKNAPQDKKYRHSPKYAITLAFGSRLEPYIVDIKPME